MDDKWIFWLDEIGKEQNDVVGKKCANLAEIRKIGLPAPHGFALSLKAQHTFFTHTNIHSEIKQFLCKFEHGVHGIKEYYEASEGLREILESKAMPKNMLDTIASFYDDLCSEKQTEVSLAVRSAGTASHPGQYETYLNVRGYDDLIDKVIKVWSSIYNPRTIASLDRYKVPIEDSPYIGVAVIEMVDARSAGIAFTADPTKGDLSKIMIEGNWGLGESVVSGSTTPDAFILDKDTLSVMERRIGDKVAQIVRSDKGVVEEELPSDKRAEACINDEEAAEIAALAKKLESHFGVPQDVEWAIANDLPFPKSIFLLQTRPAKIFTSCR